jgi:hypothetical protein
MMRPSEFKQKYDEICARKTDLESRLALINQQKAHARIHKLDTSNIMEKREKLLQELHELATELATLRLQRHEHHRGRATRGE